MQYETATAVAGLSYAEGLRWHDGALWFSDMLEHRVLRYRPGAGTDVIADVRSPSGIGFAPDGAAYVVGRDDDALYRVAPGPPVPVADLAAIGMVRANEMIVDGAGRCFIGCLGKEYESGDEHREWDDRAPGTLAFLDLAGTAPFSGTIVARGLGCPNGMVISDRGDQLYVAETYGQRVLAYPIGPHGELGARRVLVQLDAIVDGMTGDGNGMWVAAGPRFVRIDAGGRIIDEITVSTGATAIACALGGSTGRTLFMAVAVFTMEEFVAGRASSEIRCAEVRASS